VKRRGVRAAVAVSKNLAPGNGFSASTSDVALLLSVSSANLCNAARGAGTTTRFQHRESKDCDDCRSSCDLVIILFLEEEEDRLVLLIAAPRRNRLPHPNPNAAAAILFPLQNAIYIYFLATLFTKTSRTLLNCCEPARVCQLRASQKNKQTNKQLQNLQRNNTFEQKKKKKKTQSRKLLQEKQQRDLVQSCKRIMQRGLMCYYRGGKKNKRGLSDDGKKWGKEIVCEFFGYGNCGWGRASSCAGACNRGAIAEGAKGGM
jgi:hypothetical protein